MSTSPANGKHASPTAAASSLLTSVADRLGPTQADSDPERDKRLLLAEGAERAALMWPADASHFRALAARWRSLRALLEASR